MSATAWLVIAIVGFSLAGVALVAAIFMFIKMDIPAIIGDLTGKTVAREIKALRAANASSSDKRFRPSEVNVEQAPLDAAALKKAHASRRLDKTTGQLGDNATEVLSDNATEVLSDNATEVLSDNATEVLSDNATEVLSDNATEVLSDNATEVLSGGTTVLEETEELENISTTPVLFKVVKSEEIIHSDEVIY